MRIFRTRYKIERNGVDWLTVLCRKWYWKWEYVAATRSMEEAREIIRLHKNPIVWEE